MTSSALHKHPRKSEWGSGRSEGHGKSEGRGRSEGCGRNEGCGRSEGVAEVVFLNIVTIV